MSTTDYRNQEALNRALNIYRTYMRSFIIFHLKKIPGQKVEDIVMDSLDDAGQSDRADEIDRLLRQSNRDIKSIIDIDDFPRLVNKNWRGIFEKPLNDDKTFQNQLWLIKYARDESWAHPPEGDAESEGTRAYLFLIADVLRKINKPDQQHKVETIRDELFPDTAEHLAEAEKRLKDLESEKSGAEKRLVDVESEKKEYEEKNAALSKQVDEKENQRKKLDRQLKTAKTQNDKYKKDIAGTKQRLKESEAAQADYKKRFETKSKELKGTHEEWKGTEEHLATALNQLAAAQAVEKGITARLRAVQNLFTVAAIGKQEVQEVFQSVYPPIETNSTVRILDRRDVEKKNYLLALLEQKQPTIIYVQSEEMVNKLLTHIVPEKADLIGRHSERTSEAEEREILEKLENGELIAVVSDTIFSALTSAHCVEHFVFCHLAPSLDKFFKQCEPAFTSEGNAYLHLIYNSDQDVKGLDQKYPDRKTLEKFYPELRKLTETNGNLIRPESIYNELDIAKQGIETGLAIFEELQLLERNDEGIRLLPPAGKKLDTSEIYRRGEQLKSGAADFQVFQFEQSIEQIWEALLKELNVDNENILETSSVYEVRAFQDAIEDSRAQPEPSTDAVENDSKSDAEVSEAQSEPSTDAVEDNNTLDSEDTAAKPRSVIAERYVRETTEAERNSLAVQIAEMRINATGSRPIAWKKIREQFGLKNDQFHKVIRLSKGYRDAVIARIKTLKAQDSGWEYNGKLGSLTGIDDIEDFLK